MKLKQRVVGSIAGLRGDLVGGEWSESPEMFDGVPAAGGQLVEPAL